MNRMRCIGLAFVLAALGFDTRRVVVSPAPPPTVTPATSHPYRGAIPEARPATLSGQRITLVLALSLVATAAAVPLLLHRARWLEIESVLLAWWAIWALIVGLVAYRGHEAADDYELAIAIPLASTRRAAPRPRRRGWSLLGDILSAANDGEAFVIAVVLVIALTLVFAGAWVLVEIVCPCLFFVAHVALLGAVRRSRGHAGSLRAAGIGVAWATAYTAPLAAIVWLVHALAA